MQTHDNSLAYLSSYDATNASLPYAKMVNAAGYTVTASQTAVQAAMTAYRPSIDNGTNPSNPLHVHRRPWIGSSP